MSGNPAYTFGPFSVDVERRRVVRDGVAVPLAPKAFDTLLALLERRGRVVEKDELMRIVWPDTFVAEENLTQNISVLRKALGDSVDGVQFIITIPRRGYQFVAAPEAPAPDVPALPTMRRITRRAFTAVSLVTLVSAGTGVYLSHRRTPAPPGVLSLRQITFRRGSINSARFSPDGHTVVFSAAWDGKPYEVQSIRVDTAQSLPLPFSRARVLSVSRAGELALLTGLQGEIGTLARVPLGGSALREVIASVVDADLAPDGVAFAVVPNDTDGGSKLEYPAGHVIYAAAGAKLFSPRVSPDGALVAVFEQDREGGGRLTIVDRTGRVTARSRRWSGLDSGVAWTPSGSEVWFNASEVGSNVAIHAIARDGAERIVEQGPGAVRIQDIAPDGKAVIIRELIRAGMASVAIGEQRERDLSWLDWSRPIDLSSDGTTLLFGESGAGGGANPLVFVRKTDGSPAVRIGEGSALALSPDGKWVLAVGLGAPSRLMLLPTGAGRPRPLEPGSLDYFGLAARWTPDGDRVVFAGGERGRPRRVYAQRVSGGFPYPITPEGSRGPLAVSHDGKYVFARDPSGSGFQYPIDTGEPKPVNGLHQDDTPIRFSADGRFLWALARWTAPPQIVRLEIATGHRTVWREIVYADPAGVDPDWLRVVISADGRGYVYGYMRELSEMFIAEGLK